MGLLRLGEVEQCGSLRGSGSQGFGADVGSVHGNEPVHPFVKQEEPF